MGLQDVPQSCFNQWLCTVYKVDLYTGKKTNVKKELGENVVPNLTKSLSQSNCFGTIDNLSYVSKCCSYSS